MSEKTKNRLVDTVIAIIATIIVSGFLVSKESAAAHNADIQKVISLQERTLDAICDVDSRPKPRACTAAPIQIASPP